MIIFLFFFQLIIIIYILTPKTLRNYDEYCWNELIKNFDLTEFNQLQDARSTSPTCLFNI